MSESLLLWAASLVLALLSEAVRRTDHSVVTLLCVLLACAVGYGLATFSFINVIRGI